MYTARSPSVFVERLLNATGASTPDDNEPLVKTYDLKQTKLSTTWKGSLLGCLRLAFTAKYSSVVITGEIVRRDALLRKPFHRSAKQKADKNHFYNETLVNQL